MRLPNSTDMSKEQKAVYLDAPLDGIVFITGPPGTGKTVIAFLRADAVVRGGKKVQVTMYNRVLKAYTKNAAEGDYGVSTLHHWIMRWWKKIAPSADRETADRFDLDCPFDEKEDAKALGAQWDRPGRKWWVSGDKFRESPEAYSKWDPEPAPISLPTEDDDSYNHDWDKMTSILVRQAADGLIQPSKVDWGHLIIDESQDFPVQMFYLLRTLRKSLYACEGDTGMPAVTVSADDNQRLNPERNATIAEIRKTLAVKDERCYLLKRNYRNTKPIAELAARFQVGLSTGAADLPKRDGDIPLLRRTKNINDAVEFIKRYANNYDNQQIGVIVQNNKMRKKFYNRLSSGLKGSKTLKVQTYASNDKEHSDDSLELDRPGILSVFNKHSCKGLEFDAVFLPEIQEYSMSSDDLDQFKMDMYVMISRARTHLSLMYTSPNNEDPKILEHLPRPESGTLVWET